MHRQPLENCLADGSRATHDKPRSRLTRTLTGAALAALACFTGTSRADFDTPAGWIDWQDTGIVANSSPTAAQDPGSPPSKALDLILYANSADRLSLQGYGSPPQLVGPNKHAMSPACWVDGNPPGVCVAFSGDPHRLMSTYAKASAPTQPPCPRVGIACKIAQLPYSGNAKLTMNLYDGSSTSPAWVSLGLVGAATKVSLARDAKNLLHIFAVFKDSTLQERTYVSGQPVSNWKVIPGKFSAPPGCMKHAGTLQCYAPSDGGRMVRLVFDGSSWQAPVTLVHDLSATPSMVKWDTGRSDMFYASGSHLMHTWGDANTWVQSEDLGGHIDSSASSVQCFSFIMAMRCYALFSDGHIWEKFWLRPAGTVLSFTSDQYNVQQGGSTVLRWSVVDCPPGQCIYRILSKPASSANPASILKDGLPSSGSLPIWPTFEPAAHYVFTASTMYGYHVREFDITVTPKPDPTTPPPQLPGYSQVQIWNCRSDSPTVNVWASVNGGAAELKGSVAFQGADDGACGQPISSPGYVLPITDGRLTTITYTNPQRPGCDIDSPTEGACVVGITPYVLGQTGGAAATVLLFD